ncbi:hypothetical protein BC826DRAFT_97529 [Russula brevipes]|nr:hypothetical protein BC826DRAFT_97529 [Russula brevipes]
MIIEEVTPELCDANWSYEPTITESSLSSDSDTPFCERSPALFGSLRFFNSFSLPRLFNHSSCNFDPEDPVNDALRNSVRPLDEGEDPVFTFPAEWVAVFRDSDSGVSLSQGTAAMPTHEDEEALVRTSIRSLDVGEEPVFELPSGWNESLVSPSDRAVPSSSQAQTTRRTSVLPKLKSLWKRATSKFAWR